MKRNLDFLIEISRLKEIPRTGWGIWRIQNPETIAEHTFRVCFLAFLLGKKRGLNLKTAIQTSLFHDFCEVYAGDATPLFYYQNLDVKKRKDREILMKGIRLFAKEKRKRSKIKFEKEKKSLLKLIAPLRETLKKEIFLRWLDYENGFSREGKFVKQIDWIENLIQSLEYLGARGSGSGWWEIAEEKVYNPFLLDFLKVIQKKFYYRPFLKNYKKQRELENILDFILTINKLKRMPRLYWATHGIRNPETVAGHAFTVTSMVWLLGKEKKQLKMERLLKMALCHELSAVYTGDTIPYIKRLPRNKKKRKEILKKWPRLPEDEKARRFLREYKEEKEALLKLTSRLEPGLKKEIIELWDEYRRAASPEAIFVNQVNVLSVLFQGLQYQKKYKNFSANPLWEWAFEKCDDPVTLEFMKELHQKFR